MRKVKYGQKWQRNHRKQSDFTRTFLFDKFSVSAHLAETIVRFWKNGRCISKLRLSSPETLTMDAVGKYELHYEERPTYGDFLK